jgi:serine phosphatase RsbU (regulator of sigma subunit)
MATHIDLLPILKSIELFQEIPTDALMEISKGLKEKHVIAGERIIQKGEEGTCLYILYTGRVYVHDGDLKFAEIAEKQAFGESSLLNSEPRNASITAMEDSILFQLDQSDFYRIIGNNASFMKGIIKVLIQRLAEQNKELIDTLRERETQLTILVEQRTSELQKAMLEIQSQKVILEKSYEEILLQKSEIEEKNEKIFESIRYAKNIQKSILPSRKKLYSAFPDSFVLYKPRDVVSGDFYWFQEIPNKIGVSIIAAVDCTGHGVPGALMSMIGNGLLNDIIQVRQIIEPHKILAELHTGVNHFLNQERLNNRDGMDISICRIDRNQNKIYFSGAMNSLYLVQDGELVEYKGDRKSIGGSTVEENLFFTEHEIPISSDTRIYIFSDGYIHQFSYKDHKKFSSKRFKDLLKKIYLKPMLEQKFLLEEAMFNWMGSQDQLDDMLVLGINLERFRDF